MMGKAHHIGSVSEIRQNGGRKRLTVGGKDIFVLLHKGQVFALDSFCYHAGGPLYLGDIEDVSGHSCVVCPWHKYKLTIQDGEGLYYSVDPHNRSKPPVLQSKGVKQRTHEVTVQGEDIYVTLSDDSTEVSRIESDQYNKKSS